MPDTSNQPRRTVIHEETVPCNVPLDELDLDWLRRQFSALFDRAAGAVNRAGYDLDDVIVERFVTTSAENRERLHTAPHSLSDSDRFVREITAALRGQANANPVNPKIVGHSVRVTLEQW